MTMTARELAEQLTGIQAPVDRHLSKELIEQAKEAGLVIVFGEGDDLMEFRGAINDEAGAYEGTTVLVDGEGRLPYRNDIDEDDELENYFRRKPEAKTIQACWCDDEIANASDQPADGFTWTYRTAIPHATFAVMEDDEHYCRGIVFALADAGVGDPEELNVQELHLSPAGLEASLEGGAAGVLAKAFHEQFSESNATNYLELTFHPKDGGQIIVTIQKANGLTPGAKVAKIKDLIRAGKIDEALAL